MFSLTFGKGKHIMNVTVNRAEILNLLKDLIMSYIAKAYSVEEASRETADTLREPLRRLRQN